MKEFKISGIGVNAGKIWSELEHRATEVAIKELCHFLSITFEEATLAIGWLAKEKNILIYKRNGHLMLSKKSSDFSWG